MRVVHKNPVMKILPILIHLNKLNRGKKYSSLSIFICWTNTPANFKDNYRSNYKMISCLKRDILYICDINWNVKCLLWTGIGAHSQYWVNPSVVHSQAYLLTNVNQIVIAAQIILQNVKSNIYFYFSSQSQRIWCDIRSFIYILINEWGNLDHILFGVFSFLQAALLFYGSSYIFREIPPPEQPMCLQKYKSVLEYQHWQKTCKLLVY